MASGQMALLQYVTQQEYCHSGGSGEDSSGSQSWHWGHGPNHQVRPQLYGAAVAKAETGAMGDNAVRPRQKGGSFI